MSTPLITNDLEQLAEHAQEASALLKQLSNQHRLIILCSLVDGELSVTELNSRTNLSQSALSQHLASLRSAKLVQTRREAQTIFYQLQGSEAIQVIKVLKSIYCS